jgi:hypothetical protein
MEEREPGISKRNPDLRHDSSCLAACNSFSAFFAGRSHTADPSSHIETLPSFPDPKDLSTVVTP